MNNDIGGAGSAAALTSSHNHQVLEVLGALKEASRRLQNATSPESSVSSVKALLQFGSSSILSSDRHLSALSAHLSDLKSLVPTQESKQPDPKHKTGMIGIRSFLTNRVRAYEISRVAAAIESEIQAWIDRENVANLMKTLGEYPTWDEEMLLTQLSLLRRRLSQGFDTALQNTLLKSKLLQELQFFLCRTEIPKRVREMVAYSLKEAVLFNRDVFIGEVEVGVIVKALASMGSICSLEVLKALTMAIKSPLVDELESCGVILKIIGALDSPELGTRIMAAGCVMEIGYYGRKEAVEGMMGGGIVEKLVELQRAERHAAFSGCVGLFAVQLAVGEGLRRREKRAFRQKILKGIRKASVSDAEAATLIAEVLWGSN